MTSIMKHEPTLATTATTKLICQSQLALIVIMFKFNFLFIEKFLTE